MDFCYEYKFEKEDNDNNKKENKQIYLKFKLI